MTLSLIALDSAKGVARLSKMTQPFPYNSSPSCSAGAESSVLRADGAIGHAVARPSRSLRAVSVVGAAVLMLLVLLLPQRLVFDEPLYLVNVEHFQRYGFSDEFLRALTGQAGPFYVILHSWLAPVTRLEAPAVRLVNVVAFFFASALLARHLRHRGSAAPLTSALAMLGVPTMWVMAGLALTEVPSMMMLVVALLGLYLALDPDRPSSMRASIAFVSGLAFGMALTGRQTYLVVLPALSVLVDRPGRLRELSLFVAGAAVLALPVFIAWQGLASPRSNTVMGIVLEHGVLACAYAGLMMLVLAPRMFRLERALLVGSFLLAALACALLPRLVMTPLRSVTRAVVPTALLPLVAYAASVTVVAIGLAFLVSLTLAAFERRHDRWFVFSAASVLLILGSTVGIVHQFASRYVATALPFLVVVAAPFECPGRAKAIRVGAGMVLGMISLVSYFGILTAR